MAVPQSSVVPPDPAVNTAFAEFHFNFDPQVFVGQSTIAPNSYPFEDTGYTSGYLPDQPPIYFPGLERNPPKRRRLIGFNSMSSADEPSSPGIGYQEKLPIADHDSASLTPRWAPAVSDVQSLGSPLACVAESITNCCNFGWQQPAGMQAALPPPCGSFLALHTV